MDETTNNKTKSPNPNQEESHVQGMISDIGNFFRKFGNFIHDITDIKEGLDEQGTRDSIKKNIEIKGSNVWLLGAAIMVASLGLDLNSPAVIIGAMLISPLMSPILGIGLSIGINDRTTLYQSLYHFGIAIAVSLIVSCLYFFLTPLGIPTSEILARTSPTLLDVLVAFFGGIAGIVSGSRMEKSNAIPGVAIATALLPPLCVSGYGLATGNWVIFFNSFYLFFLNCIFIALATYIVVRLLGFRQKKYVNSAEQKRATLAIFVFVLIMIIPSVFILRGVVQEVQRDVNIERYITEKLERTNRHISWECSKMIDKNGKKTDSLLLNISLIGDIIPKDSIEFYEQMLPTYNVRRAKLSVVQTYSSDISKIDERRRAEIHEEKEAHMQFKQKKEKEITQLHYQIDSLKGATHTLKNIALLYPKMEHLSFGELTSTDTSQQIIPTLTVKWNRSASSSYRRTVSKRLGSFVREHMELDTIQVLELQ